MRVNGLNIFIDANDNLLLQKSRRRLVKDLLLLFLFVILVISVSAYILSKKEIGLFEKPLVGTVMLLFIFFVITMIISNLLISFKNATDYLIAIRGNGLYINNIIFCPYSDLEFVEIRQTNGWDGIGESFVVGLLARNRFFPLTFYHSNKDATKIAQIISGHLKREIKIRKSKVFSLFKGY